MSHNTADLVLFWLAGFAGRVAGSLYDPPVWLMIFVVLLTSTRTRKYWTPLLIAVCFTAWHVFEVQHRFPSDQLPRFAFNQLLVKTFIAYVLFALTRILLKLIGKGRDAEA